MNSQPIPRYTDLSVRHIAFALSALALAAIVAAFFIEVEMKQDVPCEIVAVDEIGLKGFAGTVTEVLNGDGQVQAGAPLFRLQSSFATSADGLRRQEFEQRSREQRLEAAELQDQARTRGHQSRMQAQRGLRQAKAGELELVRGQVARHRALVAQAERMLERLQAYRDYVSGERVEMAISDLEQRRIGLQQAMARENQLRAELGQIQASIAQAEAEAGAIAADGLRERDAARTAYENQRSDILVSAPMEGVVRFSAIYPGKHIEPGEVAMVLSRTATPRLRAVLKIPSRKRGFVAVGQDVRIKFDAFPYARFGSYPARIATLSPATMREAEASRAEGAQFLGWIDLDDPFFRTADGAHPILPGMQATAAIVVERRSIAEWVLAPMFEAIRG